MKYLCLSATLFLSSLVLAQAAPQPAPQPAQQPAAPTEAKELPPDAPVITIYDLCKEKLTNLGACKTIITRAQFEQMLDAVGGSKLPPQARREVASRYARVLTLATEAEKEGVDNQPQAKELVQIFKEQALAQAMQMAMLQRSQATPEEIQKFYDDNRERLTRVTLERVVVPLKPAADSKATEADMKKLADELRQRAVGGADFKTLEAEAYQKAGLKNPPETKLLAQPDTLPANLKPVLQLQPGAVSQVMQDQTGFHFAKLVSKEVTPLDSIKEQIGKLLAQRKAQQEEAIILNSSKPNLNPDYFGPAQAPEAPPQK